MTSNPIISRAHALLDHIEQNPDLLVHIRPPRDSSPALSKRPKVGEKVRGVKPNFHRQVVDMSAVEMMIDLETALDNDDYEEIVRNYYSLSHLLCY